MLYFQGLFGWLAEFCKKSNPIIFSLYFENLNIFSNSFFLFPKILQELNLYLMEQRVIWMRKKQWNAWLNILIHSSTIGSVSVNVSTKGHHNVLQIQAFKTSPLPVLTLGFIVYLVSNYQTLMEHIKNKRFQQKNQ